MEKARSDGSTMPVQAARDEAPETEAAGESKKGLVVRFEGGKTFQLLFDGDQNVAVYLGVKELAEEEYRSINQQILYFLRRGTPRLEGNKQSESALYDDFKTYAKEQGRSLNSQILFMLREALAKREAIAKHEEAVPTLSGQE